MHIIRIYYPGGQFDLPHDPPHDDVSEAIRQFRQLWPDQPVEGISVFKQKTAPAVPGDLMKRTTRHAQAAKTRPLLPDLSHLSSQ